MTPSRAPADGQGESEPESAGAGGFRIEGLEITPEIARSLERDGISEPTPVQAEAIPPLLAGGGAWIQSGTGTGKTLAYLLPILQELRTVAEARALIVAPSPELALQILRTAEAYKHPSITSTSLVGSGNPHRQREKLKRRPRLVVGTPGRVLECILGRRLPVRGLSSIVFDETDRVLTTEGGREWRRILSRPERTARLVFASATFGAHATELARDFLPEGHARIRVDQEVTREAIRHEYEIVHPDRREIRLAKAIEGSRARRTLVFVNRSRHVGHLWRYLTEHGIACETLSAERSKTQRRRALEALRAGDVRVVVATDTAARGLDVRDLDLVVQYEVARDVDTYIHRAGRTGRAGRAGVSLTFASRPEVALLRQYARDLGFEWSRRAPARRQRED